MKSVPRIDQARRLRHGRFIVENRPRRRFFLVRGYEFGARARRMKHPGPGRVRRPRIVVDHGDQRRITVPPLVNDDRNSHCFSFRRNNGPAPEELV
jgi:hypothetical protein